MAEEDNKIIGNFMSRFVSELRNYGYVLDEEGRTLYRHEGGAAFSVVSVITVDAARREEAEKALVGFSESFGKGAGGRKICRELIIIDRESSADEELLRRLTENMKASGTVGDIVIVNPETGKYSKTGGKNFVSRAVGKAVEFALGREKVVQTTKKTVSKADFVPVYLLIAVNVTLFLADMLLEIFRGVRPLTDLGIQDNGLITAGQYWRLFTPMFLHADIFHLLGNMLALNMIGKAVLSAWNKSSFLTFYFVSGLCGNVLGFFFVNGLSLGASGAVMGLGGVMIYMILFSENGKFYRTRSNYLYVGFIVLYNLIYGLLPIAGNVNNFAHFGGFAAGFILAVLFGALKKKKTAEKDSAA